MRLFGDNGKFTLTPEKLVVNFSHAIGPDDLRIISDCLTRALTALSRFVPESQFASELVNCHAVLGIAGGSAARDRFLNQYHQAYMDHVRSGPDLKVSAVY